MLGDAPADLDLVEEKINEILLEKVNATLEFQFSTWTDWQNKYNMQLTTGGVDLIYTANWAEYGKLASSGAFVSLDNLLDKVSPGVRELLGEDVLNQCRVGGELYTIPCNYMEYTCNGILYREDLRKKYDLPVPDSLENMEAYLAGIKEKEPDVVPLYLTKDYTAPTYMDKIQDPVGIEYGDDSLTVKNVFETERMKSTLATMRKYYTEGYINKDAATASDDKSIKRFVTKGDGQPYAELIWGKDLGYEVVATQIMDTKITNASARGALTAVNKNSEHPEKAIALLNLINTDEYLRNLLNYGIEGVHWEKAEPDASEVEAAEGKDYVYDFKIKLDEAAKKDYSVPYWVQGGLFNTYVLDNEPLDKWATFKEFNDASEEAPSFGFDFDLDPVSTQVAGFRNVLDEFGKSLYTGSVDPEEYLPQLQKKLEATGVQDVIDEMQSQIDEWKDGK